ncbi:MAG: hypothetical protein ACRCSF_10440 [Mycobacteriaceae bacterium]
MTESQNRLRQGAFGLNWWGRQWVLAMEDIGERTRLHRGRIPAKNSQVITFSCLPGKITGEVQGSQLQPFTASFFLKTLEPDVLTDVQHLVRDASGMLSALASGEIPQELAGLLLPSSSSDIDYDCTCPDQVMPCKHAGALVYLMAQLLDKTPSELLRLRGVDLESLISDMDSHISVDLLDFYGDQTVLPSLPQTPFQSAIDDLDESLLHKALRADFTANTEIATVIADVTAFYRLIRERNSHK